MLLAGVSFHSSRLTRGCGNLIPCRWFNAQQVSHKEVVALVISVGCVTVATRSAVIGPGNHQQIEIFVVLD
jgi:hypothetical protein